MLKKNILLIVFLGLFVFNISLAYGQGIVPEATGNSATDVCPSGDQTYCGNYELNDFVSLAINVSKWILGIVGSLALVMFIYGGVMFLISGGGSEMVTKAKKIIVAAVIGLIIVFASFLIIKFVMGSMGLDWNGKIAVPTAQ
ncbi:MAG: pilin [bacterium]|nr:pilin [bacterium]